MNFFFVGETRKRRLCLAGSVSERNMVRLANVNQDQGKEYAYIISQGRFEAREMNRKGRLIVTKIGKYSHLTICWL